MTIQEHEIAAAFGAAPLLGNEEGLIPAFGLHLTRHLADYYNRVSFGFHAALLRAAPELGADAEQLLIEAGRVCAFNTFGGIMTSMEWDAVVLPMCESREDWVRGMVAIINILGWGRWEIDALTPGERLAVRIEDSYEAEGYLRDYPVTDRPRCFLATGGVAGLMNLLYHSDVTARPIFSEEFYVATFRHPRSFVAREVSCRARGDACCEVVAERPERG